MRFLVNQDVVFPWPISVRTAAILLLGGVNLMLIQWIMIRELTALLLGTELVAVVVTGSVFVGYSLGYLLSSRIAERQLRVFAMLTFPLHLVLPILYRLIMSSLDNVGQFRIGFVILLALTPFIVSSFYSMFLPRFANASGGLVGLYAVELCGAALGVLGLLVLGNHGLLTLYAPYTLIALFILVLVGVPRRVMVGFAAFGLGWLAALPVLDAQSNAFVYQTVHNISGAKTLASVYSAYQKVDVLRDTDGGLYLYLNGLMDYGSRSLVRFNVLLSAIPAQLLHPRQMAVVGSGSMSSVALAAPYAGNITTVELDPVVAELSQRYFGDINHLQKLSNWTLVIDDAKHYFGISQSRYDLITMDVPAPFTVQEGALHTVEYYALLKQHLSPDGIVSVSLSSTFHPNHVLARRVVAGLLANFKEVIVVTSGSADLSFAYAGNSLPFDSAALEKVLKSNNESQYVIYQLAAVQTIVGDAAPIRIDDMSEIWGLSLAHLQRILGGS